MKLNLGSGKRDLEGYVNIDAVKQTDNTVVGDILNLDYPDNSIEKIYNEHIIEHLDKNEIKRFFSECRRMLKPGGELELIAPAMLSVIMRFINKETFGFPGSKLVDIDTLDSFLFADHTHPYDYHKQSIYKEKLERLCSEYGFKVVKIYYQDRDHSYNEIVLKAYKETK